MKKLLASVSIVSLVAAAGLALAQTPVLPQVQGINATDLFQDVVTGVPGAASKFASALQLQAWLFGQNSQRTGVPALTNCSATGGTIVGTDYAFTVTGGNSASTTCTATFATAYKLTPVCIVSSRTAPGTTTPSYAVSTTAVTITQASLASEVYDVVCVAQPNG